MNDVIYETVVTTPSAAGLPLTRIRWWEAHTARNCMRTDNNPSAGSKAGERIFRLMLATASGQRTKSELHGYGQNEFVPWQLGAVR